MAGPLRGHAGNRYVRNLATMTRLGVISPMVTVRACEVLGRIGTERGRVHPIGVLSALLTYRSGRGVRGQHSWEPVSQVVDALDAAFERSFAQAPQTGSRLCLGIDVSGSMGHGEVAGVPNLTPRTAVARREPNHYLAAFASRSGTNTRNWRDAEMATLDITAQDSITDAVRKTQALPFGGTDCALPMLDALNRGQRFWPGPLIMDAGYTPRWRGFFRAVKKSPPKPGGDFGC